MNKITKIIEAKNIELYGNGCIKSIENTPNFLLKFELETNGTFSLQEFYFVLDKKFDNNFNFSVYKDYENFNKITLCIEGDKTQLFAIEGIERKKA